MGVRFGGRPHAGSGSDELKFTILAWGKAGRSPEAELVERYLARIPGGVRLIELAEGAAPPPPPPGSRSIVLDEGGENFTSIAFAHRLGRWRDESVRETRFLIGPADGHDEAAKATADLLLAFGAATWPHLLVRAMLAEQLYRATAILAGHPYHRP